MLIVGFVQAQDFPTKGVPYLVNFSPEEYKNAGKIWDIESAPNGILYMATDLGLLAFDGLDWTLLHGSKGITRSVLVVNDSTIFTGSDLDFGQWKRDCNGLFKYKSLFPFKDNVQDGIEEFWHIYQIDGNLAFVSTFNIYILNNGQLTKIQSPSHIVHSFIHDNNLFVFDRTNRMWKFDNLKFIEQTISKKGIIPNFKGTFIKNNELCFVTESVGIVAIQNNEVYFKDSPLSNYLKGAKVFSFELIGERYIAVGTVLKGLIIADMDGNILHVINRFKGLQNNTVLSLHFAENGKLWAGLDYGLSYLLLKNNYTYVFDHRGDFGTAYTSFLQNDDFYLGTNQGLFHCKWSDLNNNADFFSFNLVAGSEGQVWKIYGYQDEIFVGHDRGLFMLKNKNLVPIDTKVGIWDMVFNNDYLFAGTYNGIALYKKNKYGYSFVKKIDSISGSCKQLAFDKTDNLWVNIPNFALVKVKLNKDFVPTVRLNTFEYDSSCSFLQLQLLNDSVLLHGENKLYSYINEKNSFVSIKERTTQFSLKNSLKGIISNAFLDEFYSFMPVNNGFALYRKGNFSPNSISTPIIKRVETLNSDSSFSIEQGSFIPFKNNSLRFVFVVPNCENVFYQYRLNENEPWSLPTQKNYLEIFMLEAGDYSFQVRAFTTTEVSEIASFNFQIQNPWYRTWQFVSSLVLFFILLIALFYLRHKRALAKQQKLMLLREKKAVEELAEKHQKALVELEQQKLEHENEKLRELLRAKTVELANKARDNESKNRLLVELKEKLIEMRDNPRIAVQRMKELMRMVDSNILNEDHTFEIQMDELHQEFFRKLKALYPSLSGNDLRICAYLKVGLNSKEIAEIMNIQLSSSYITRSRIRKKLNLDAEQNLYDFLNNL